MFTTKQIRLLAVRAWGTAGGILFVTKMRIAPKVVVLYKDWPHSGPPFFFWGGGGGVGQTWSKRLKA